MTATRDSLGTVSFRSSSRFPSSSGARVDNPVMFPPGRARLATNPVPTGSPSLVMTMGIVVVASLAARVAAGPAETMMSTLRRTSSAARSGSRSNLLSAQSPLYGNVFTLHVAKLAQALQERLDAGRDVGTECSTKVPDPRDVRWLLRPSHSPHILRMWHRWRRSQANFRSWIFDFRLSDRECHFRRIRLSFMGLSHAIHSPKSEIQRGIP